MEKSGTSRIPSPSSPLFPTHPTPASYHPRDSGQALSSVLQDQPLGAGDRKSRTANIPEPLAPFNQNTTEDELGTCETPSKESTKGRKKVLKGMHSEPYIWEQKLSSREPERQRGDEFRERNGAQAKGNP